MNLYAYCGNNPINWIDPWGEARISTRPMESKGADKLAKWLKGDTVYAHHWQVVFDDGTNIGFFDDKKIRPDTNTNYTNTISDNLNDAMLRLAVANVNQTWDTAYNFKDHNCQDYATAVLREYGRLKRENKSIKKS